MTDDVGQYARDTIDSVVKGRFTDKHTALGDLLTMTLYIVAPELALAGTSRDLTCDIINLEDTPWYVTALDALGFGLSAFGVYSKYRPTKPISEPVYEGETGKPAGEAQQKPNGSAAEGSEKGIQPSLSKSGKPKGKYEVPDPKDPLPIEGQNKAADFLANEGFDIEMLPNTKGGNGYGIQPTKSPDFLIEGEVFDCFTPKVNTNARNIASTIETKTIEQASKVVLNLNDSALSVDDIIYQITEYPISTLDELIIIKDGQYYKFIP